jgi:hypothetical protein
MDAKLLLEQMRNQRKRWVQLSEGKRVQILLPTELEVVQNFVKPGDEGKLTLAADYPEVQKFVCGWEGITEADLLGAAVGASDAVEFNTELWSAFASENLEHVRKVARALLDGIAERTLAQQADAKN